MDSNEKWYEKLVDDHPFPWKYIEDDSDNGCDGSVDALRDTNGNCICSSYMRGHILMDALWNWYITEGSKLPVVCEKELEEEL